MITATLLPMVATVAGPETGWELLADDTRAAGSPLILPRPIRAPEEPT